MRDPFVAAVLDAHRWMKRGHLEAHLGGEIPEALRRGIDVYESALNAVLAHDAELDRKKRQAEADHPPGPTPRQFTRRFPGRKIR